MIQTATTTTSILLMLHAAYSCLHYRTIYEDMFDLQLKIPIDIYIEIGISFTLLLINELMTMGKFQTVTIQADHQRLDAPTYMTRNFDIYTHRGKFM
mmetsp:Transcript_23513/g.66531  ORF Transcript_23513/g.66531 Transcript_23513/m.66531 type:complete len:97 (-) Transcript_23513:108-398(-)